jgi:hypothetical protein
MDVRQFRRVLAGFALVVGVGACASVPAPTEQLAVARSMLSQAQSAGATQHAPVELNAARTKLDQAEEAMRREDHERARQLAEQAEVDARLAWTKSDTARSQRAAAEVQQGIEVLKQELQRR